MNDFIDLLLLLIPRWQKFDVALGLDYDGSWYVVCHTEYMQPEDELFIEAYGILESFTWFGWASGGEATIYKVKGDETIPEPEKNDE